MWTMSPLLWNTWTFNYFIWLRFQKSAIFQIPSSPVQSEPLLIEHCTTKSLINDWSVIFGEVVGHPVSPTAASIIQRSHYSMNCASTGGCVTGDFSYLFVKPVLWIFQNETAIALFLTLDSNPPSTATLSPQPVLGKQHDSVWPVLFSLISV